MKTIEETWRWFGPEDPVTLSEIRQTGATGIVTALHHIPNGEVWSEAEINRRREVVEAAGLTWSVVESVPVHEAIKQQLPGCDRYIDNYCETIRNLGRQGVHTICYNFMPVIDWTRTDLEHRNPDGSVALQFDPVACIAFDLFVLKREEARNLYRGEMVEKARRLVDRMNSRQIQELERCILAGLPGAEESYSLGDFAGALDAYRGLDAGTYRAHLRTFLERIIPVAEQLGVQMAIHPDDPPVNLFGLPRIVSTLEDFRKLAQLVDSPANGITLCTGSLGSRPDNGLLEMVDELAHRIHFLHLRNVSCAPDGSFAEVSHLEGHVDTYHIMRQMIIHLRKSGRRIPLRPDHGLKILDDLNRENTPGYPLIGRMKGLAEIRGMGTAIERELGIRL